MDRTFKDARALLKAFKGENYTFGSDCFDKIGPVAAGFGKKASVILDGKGLPWGDALGQRVIKSLKSSGVFLSGDVIAGPHPNAPRDDVSNIKEQIKAQNPQVIIVVGGGSCIDAAKAAAALCALGETHPDIEEYFGVGKVTEMLQKENKKLIPVVAIQCASSSAAHLTKYSNITNMKTFQKKLIVDDAVVPPKAIFDYSVTASMSRGFTADGGLDGIAHCLEVFYGATQGNYEKAGAIASLCIDMIVRYLPKACDNLGDLEAREALGLGTDLGGYAIMVGGTNGAHLTSFSLIDILSHGRACALMNPYYTVFFAPAIQKQLHIIGEIFKRGGYTDSGLENLKGRDLGLAVAEAMLNFSRKIGFPTTLKEVDGFSDEHINRALTAAKNPQLEMKLKNMPVPLSAQTVDEYMGPILQAAKTGDLSIIKNMSV
jgi:alcohol dehydrogenase